MHYADILYLFLVLVLCSSFLFVIYARLLFMYFVPFNVCLQEEVKEESDDDMGFGLFD